MEAWGSSLCFSLEDVSSDGQMLSALRGTGRAKGRDLSMPGSRTRAELGAKSCWILAQASYPGAMGIAAAPHSGCNIKYPSLRQTPQLLPREI